MKGPAAVALTAGSGQMWPGGLTGPSHSGDSQSAGPFRFIWECWLDCH